MTRDSFILYTSFKEVVDALTNEQKGILFQAILDYELDIDPVLDDPVCKIAFIPIKQTLDINNVKWEEEKKARSEAGKKGMASRWGTSRNKASITNDNTVIDVITNDNTVITNNNNVKDVITNDNTVITSNNELYQAITDNNEQYQAITKITDNVYVNEYVNDINKKRESIERKAGDDDETLSKESNEIPSLKEVELECLEQHYTCDPVVFYNFNASKGWKIGKDRIKDWKAALATWNAREKNGRDQQKQKGGSRNFIEFPQNEYSPEEFDELEKKLLEN